MTSFGTERALEKSVPPLEGASAFPASGALPQSASAAVEPPKEEAAQKIISALENPRYIWRTIGGISRETNIDPSVVAQILGQLPAEIIIESSMPDEEGRRLFTTRRHYKTKRGTINRIISAVSDVVK